MKLCTRSPLWSVSVYALAAPLAAAPLLAQEDPASLPAVDEPAAPASEPPAPEVVPLRRVAHAQSAGFPWMSLLASGPTLAAQGLVLVGTVAAMTMVVPAILGGFLWGASHSRPAACDSLNREECGARADNAALTNGLMISFLWGNLALFVPTLLAGVVLVTLHAGDAALWAGLEVLQNHKLRRVLPILAGLTSGVLVMGLAPVVAVLPAVLLAAVAGLLTSWAVASTPATKQDPGPPNPVGALTFTFAFALAALLPFGILTLAPLAMLVFPAALATRAAVTWAADWAVAAAAQK